MRRKIDYGDVAGTRKQVFLDDFAEAGHGEVANEVIRQYEHHVRHRPYEGRDAGNAVDERRVFYKCMAHGRFFLCITVLWVGHNAISVRYFEAREITQAAFDALAAEED